MSINRKRRTHIRPLAGFAPTALLLAIPVAGLQAQPADWTEPFPGHRVIGNLYAVGTAGLGVFLITSDEGHILINTGLENSTPLIRENIESVGYRLEDVRILLTMQAHRDHTAALAEIMEITGAEMWATERGRQGSGRRRFQRPALRRPGVVPAGGGRPDHQRR